MPTISELKEELRSHGLKTSGNKLGLEWRLQEHYENAQVSLGIHMFLRDITRTLRKLYETLRE